VDITVLIAVITALIAVCGWLVTRVHAQNQLISTQRGTIDALTRQLDRMDLIGEVTEKVLANLPVTRTGGPKR
jgi:hypothetical protein